MTVEEFKAWKDLTADKNKTMVEELAYVAVLKARSDIRDRQEIVISLLTEQNKLLKEQNEMLKQKLGLNEPTKAPRMNDKPKADKKPTPKPKMTTKQVKTNLAKAKTVKRKIKINPRGKNGRFTKKNKSFLARLFD